MRILILAPRRHAGHINWSFMRTGNWGDLGGVLPQLEWQIKTV